LQETKSFKETLHSLIREAGDADTNGAVCGALVGTKLGYDKLPQDWLQALPNKKWLDLKVAKFLQLCKLIN